MDSGHRDPITQQMQIGWYFCELHRIIQKKPHLPKFLLRSLHSYLSVSKGFSHRQNYTRTHFPIVSQDPLYWILLSPFLKYQLTIKLPNLPSKSRFTELFAK